MAYTIFGGTAPLVATYLIGQTGSNLAPAFYLIAISVLGLIGGMLLPETSKVALDKVTVQAPKAKPASLTGITT
jgi:MHS family proline/betaine transporter-like MFS transporter